MSKIIKYGQIVLDKETAWLEPHGWGTYLKGIGDIKCGDKDGDYSISVDMLPVKSISIAWEELYQLIYGEVEDRNEKKIKI